MSDSTDPFVELYRLNVTLSRFASVMFASTNIEFEPVLESCAAVPIPKSTTGFVRSIVNV